MNLIFRYVTLLSLSHPSVLSRADIRGGTSKEKVVRVHSHTRVSDKQNSISFFKYILFQGKKSSTKGYILISPFFLLLPSSFLVLSFFSPYFPFFLFFFLFLPLPFPSDPSILPSFPQFFVVARVGALMTLCPPLGSATDFEICV